jgi:hypothetical protein
MQGLGPSGHKDGREIDTCLNRWHSPILKTRRSEGFHGRVKAGGTGFEGDLRSPWTPLTAKATIRPVTGAA